MTATLLFDLDGTLVETDHLHLKAFQSAFKPHGVDLDWETYRTRMIGKANVVIAAEMLPHVPAERHAAIMDAKEAAYRDLVEHLEPAPGLLALLDWAEAQAIPCGVVTNAPRLNAEKVLRAMGLRHRFRALVIGDELDDAKPHPLPYRMGLEALGGSAARSVAFEDSPSGARSASAAGLAVVGLLTSFAAEVLTGVGAGLVVRDYADPGLMDFVRRRTAGTSPAGEAAGAASHAGPTSLEKVLPEKG